MFWTQAIICLLFWIATGAMVARITHRRPPRIKSAFAGSMLMVLGAFVMLAGMAALANYGGLSAERMSTFAWFTTLLLGTVFVTMQTYGAAVVMSSLSRRETSPSAKASESEETPDS